MAGTRPPKVFDEEEVRLLLADDQGINAGLSAVNEHLRNLICGRLRRYFPGLSSADLADVWQACLWGLFQAIKRGEFDLDKPLLPWVWTVARNIAISQIRRWTTQQKVAEAMGDALRGTQLGIVWNGLDRIEHQETLDAIQAAICKLPPQQRLVMQVFSSGFPETASMQVLRDRVSEASNVEHTVASVKRALQEARVKLRRIMARKGYTNDDEGDGYAFP